MKLDTTHGYVHAVTDKAIAGITIASAAVAGVAISAAFFVSHHVVAPFVAAEHLVVAGVEAVKNAGRRFADYYRQTVIAPIADAYHYIRYDAGLF